jgi:hypothetical protein
MNASKPCKCGHNKGMHTNAGIMTGRKNIECKLCECKKYEEKK